MERKTSLNVTSVFNGRLTILHTNDMHGRYRPFPVVKGNATSQTGDPGRTWDEFDRDGTAGGFSALATAVKRIRRERGPDNVLLVDGGDTLTYHNTGYTGNPIDYEGLEFKDGLDAVRQYLPDLRRRSGLVVVLSHLGSAMDRVLAHEVP